MTTLVAGAIDITILLLLAFITLPLLGRQPAALRHWVLAMTLLTGAIVPVIGPLLPDWQLAVHISAPMGSSIPSAAVSGVASAIASPEGNATVSDARQPIALVAMLVRAWLIGAVAAAAVLLFGFARLAHLAWTARPITNRRWLEHADAVARELGLRRRVALLESRDPRLLVVWGLVRPQVFVPAFACDWPDDRVRIVLTHELAHVTRGDWIVQCFAELLRAVYWFNPLLWKACARLRRESDHACDDIVLSRGVDGSEYAAHLVDIARVLRRSQAWVPAPAMAHTSGFERRVQAMLNAQLNRRPLSRRAYMVTLLVCLSLALPIAALTAAQSALVTFTGSVLDPSNAVLPNAVVTLTNTETQAKYEVRTNRDGRYEVPGLPSGRYILESRVPGFQTVKLEMSVGGQNVDRDLRLDLGTIQETVTVGAGPGWAARETSTPPPAPNPQPRAQSAPPPCPAGSAVSAGPAIGGNIRTPKKLRDRRPIYPAEHASAGVSGQVLLHATIGTDGAVRDIAVQSASNDEFAAAAREAVGQWEFAATLLNCVPVDTQMNVTVNFSYRP